MARHRHASNCDHSTDGPLFRVQIDPASEPADPARAALERFADVLNALPGPLEGVLDDLTATDIFDPHVQASVARTHPCPRSARHATDGAAHDRPGLMPGGVAPPAQEPTG